MFLKQVSMLGFKSFADRVTLTFGPGVTCIVGPNGCGKSNIVDAFKWVLGEQSAKSLRGRQMLDMIFNGSSTRRASGIAQVDLLFDNADRSLPLDVDEVTVTRKLYRSGESEYQLNKEAARLKDIRELFMDTGVGTEAYSVIEQGRVEQLVQTNPVERRLIFEEAAGISKYKARRKEAQRKLERTTQNLLRVADIVEELEKRLRSVKLAAGKARNYQEYDRRLRKLQSGKSMAQYHRLTVSLAQDSETAQKLQDGLSGLNARIDRHESEESQRMHDLDRVGEQITAVDGDLVRAQAAVVSRQERIAHAVKRTHEQQALEQRSLQRHRADSERLQSLREALAQTEGSVAQLQQQSEVLHERVDRSMAQDQAMARDLTGAQATLEDEKAGIIDLLRQTTQAHNEIISLNTHRETLLGHKGKLSSRGDQIAAELQTFVQKRIELDERLHEIERLVETEERRLEERKTEAERVDRVRSELTDHLAQTKQDRSAMHSRKDLLLDLERNMEGVGKGPRALLAMKNAEGAKKSLAAIRGLVADFFDTDVTHARIIEAALGEFDQYVVVDQSPAFLADAGAFSELPERVTILRLDRMSPVINEQDFRNAPGFVARALDLVTVPDHMEHLARHLLAKTVVVRSLADALALSRDDVYSHRFVTLEGEVVEADGRVRLGPASSSSGLISRKSELRDLDEQLESADKRIVSLEDQLDRTGAEADHLLDIQQKLRTAIHEAHTTAVEAKAGLQTTEESIRRLTSEQPLIAGEVSLLEQQIDEAMHKSAQRRDSLEAMDRLNREREARVHIIQEEIDDIFERRQASQEQVTQMRVELAQLGEKRRTAAERMASLGKDIREVMEAVERWTQDIDQCRSRMMEAQQIILQGRAQLQEQAMAVRHLDAAALNLRKRRELIRIELETLSGSVKSARSQQQETEGKLHELQMLLAQMDVRRSDLVTRTEEELGIDLAHAYEEYEHEDTDWEAVENEIVELRGKLERLGNVNLDAISELEDIEKRHAFLTSQRDDLAQSSQKLQDLIDKINVESAERFRTTFEQIRENFRGLFRRLFGGGRADIILEDPDDVLESGVEIVAQPPGKELQSISLMSGGEKSLTAIAMMMSIFQSRPSPFAILDEVDAALDEVNNERFNRLVQDFVSRSQFIIISHSRRTMSIADTLYGITMQEPGISTLVSVKLEKVGVA